MNDLFAKRSVIWLVALGLVLAAALLLNTQLAHAMVRAQVVTSETISAGASFACRIRGDGSLQCWGYDYYGQSSSVPAGVFTQVSAGAGHACALKADQSVVCWGSNLWGESSPVPAGTFTQVSAGGNHSCGLKSDNSIVCWGAGQTNSGVHPEYGQSIVPAGTYTQVSAGNEHTCAVKNDQSIVCWGDNYYGQSSPVPGGPFTQVSAGIDHGCGLKSDQSIVCWGDSLPGSAPTETFVQVSGSGYTTCGLKTDNTVACWGNAGQEPPVQGAFSQISYSGGLGCGLLQSDASPVCWGDDTYGELDPILISGNVGLANVQMQYMNGTARFVWSDDNGDYKIHVPYNWSGTVTPSLTLWPSGVVVGFSPASRTYSALTTDQVNQNYIRAVTISGFAGAAGVTLNYVDGGPKAVVADGSGLYSFMVPFNWSGTVTPALAGYRFRPTSQSYTGTVADQRFQDYEGTSGVTFPQLSVGSNQACWLTGNGALTCWGLDDFGEATPAPGTYTQVSVGTDHACGLKTDGSIACWGFSLYGRTSPPAGTFIQVSAGFEHSCAVRSDGTAVCWGDNSMRQVQPVAPGTFTQVNAGYGRSCGLRSDGSVSCWGTWNAVPPSPGPFKSILEGCGLKMDGTMECWPGLGYHVLPGKLRQFSFGLGTDICGVKTDRTLICQGDMIGEKYGELHPPAGEFTQVGLGYDFGCALRLDGSLACWGKDDLAQQDPGTVSFRSNGQQDGWVLESSETSGMGGSLNATDKTFVVGDDASNRQFKTVLSFNTKVLPDNAIIQSAVLQIRRAPSKLGTRPFTMLGTLWVDVERGVFGGKPTLQVTDFSARATAPKAAFVGALPSFGTWYSAVLNAKGLNNINRLGWTQMRLYFAKDDNNNHAANTLAFGSGERPNVGNPILFIQYTVP